MALKGIIYNLKENNSKSHIYGAYFNSLSALDPAFIGTSSLVYNAAHVRFEILPILYPGSWVAANLKVREN